MSVSKQHLAVPGDECQCGRRISIRHCTVCGSSRVYSRQRRMHNFVDGSTKFVEIQFRCQSCGHVFIDEERQFCEAPPASNVLALRRLKALKEAQHRGESLNENDAKIARALDELLADKEIASSQDEAHKKLAFQLQVEYVDLRLEMTKRGASMPETMSCYVSRRLKELGIETEIEVEDPQVVELPPPMTKQEDEVSSTQDVFEPAMSTAERTFRLEWSRLKFVGRNPTKTVEEYIERRSKGELFDE